MEVMIETCCGIDVHQKTIVCCILDGPLDTNKPKKSYKIFGTRTSELLKALEWLEENEVTDIYLKQILKKKDKKSLPHVIMKVENF